MKKKIQLTGKHILLVLLYAPGASGQTNEPVTGRTRIIKMMFIFDKEIKKEFLKDSDIELLGFPDFIPWNYGPFSKEIYNDIEFFVNNEFIYQMRIDEEKEDFEIAEYEQWAGDFQFDDEIDVYRDRVGVESFSLTERGMKFVKEKIFSHLSDNQIAILAKFKKNITSASLYAILRYTYIKYPEYTEKSEIRGKILD